MSQYVLCICMYVYYSKVAALRPVTFSSVFDYSREWCFASEPSANEEDLEGVIEQERIYDRKKNWQALSGVESLKTVSLCTLFSMQYATI